MSPRSPLHHEPEFKPGRHRGWQHEASSRVDRQLRDGDLCGRLDDRVEPHLLRRFRLSFFLIGLCGCALKSELTSVLEAGGRVTTNVMVWDLDLALSNAADARRVGSSGPMVSHCSVVLNWL